MCFMSSICLSFCASKMFLFILEMTQNDPTNEKKFVDENIKILENYARMRERKTHKIICVYIFFLENDENHIKASTKGRKRT